MGLSDIFSRKKESEECKKEKAAKEEEVPMGKYDEPCAACGGGGSDKKWMGQYWHKKCARSAKKMAKGLL